jgi:cytoskeletal protein CcmA (bactofilin family)
MKRSERATQMIGPLMALDGNVIFEGTLRLDGHVKGTIKSKEGFIIVGEEAVVHADILVCIASVSGEVRGNIRALERIELHPTARVFGDLSAPVVLIGAGAVFEGKCRIAPRADGARNDTGVDQTPPKIKADTMGFRKYAVKRLRTSELHLAFRKMMSKMER